MFKSDSFRSQRWKDVKQRTSKIVKKHKKKSYDFILDKLDKETNPGKFFNHIGNLLGKNKEKRWTPSRMYPDKGDEEVAEIFASLFNQISGQYPPLDRAGIPSTFSDPLPELTPEDVIKQMKSAKKPSSTVPEDIPARLYEPIGRKLAVPVTAILNLITTTMSWCAQWKKEYVTIIPKSKNPQDPSKCRNIACTNFLSKLYESFVLQWCRKHIRPKLNQYGGEKGCLLYTSPSPRDRQKSRMPSSA